MNELEAKAVAEALEKIDQSFDYFRDDIMMIAKHHNILCKDVVNIRKGVMFLGISCVLLGAGIWALVEVSAKQEKEINELKKEINKLKNDRA